MMNEPRSSPLPPASVLILLAVSQVMEEGGEALAAQAEVARTTSVSPTYIDVEVPANCPLVPEPDGPLPLSPTVVDEHDNPVGSILVWISDGRISLLEQAWYTDAPPTHWPTLDRVQFL